MHAYMCMHLNYHKYLSIDVHVCMYVCTRESVCVCACVHVFCLRVDYINFHISFTCFCRVLTPTAPPTLSPSTAPALLLLATVVPLLVVVAVALDSAVVLVLTAGTIAAAMAAPLSFTFGISTATDIGDFEPTLLVGDTKPGVLLAEVLATVVSPLLTSTSIGVSDGPEMIGAVFCIELATGVVFFAVLLARDAALRSDVPLSLLVRLIALLEVMVDFIEGMATVVVMVTAVVGMVFVTEAKTPGGGFICCKLFRMDAVSLGDAFLATSMSF